MSNRIYFFTGTGNSLKVAQDIASSLDDCEIVAICKDTKIDIPTGYERVGFIFPVYFAGPPKMVMDFIRQGNFTKETAKYYFAVATPGGTNGTPLALIKKAFDEKGINLDYNGKIKMPPNYVALYDMYNLLIKPALRAYPKRITPIVEDIKNMKKNQCDENDGPSEKSYIQWMKKARTEDSLFNVNNDCISCGKCKNICPARNISMENGRPVYHHQCEACMACIQHCPKKAINFGNKTQRRRRYTHPNIVHGEITKYYSHKG